MTMPSDDVILGCALWCLLIVAILAGVLSWL